jgi:ABC-type polysaccharide/polyol phosphate transport system ATPase subunit
LGLTALAQSPGPAATAAAPAIVIRDLCKTFRLPHQRYSTLKERMLHPGASRAHDELRALRDVSVEIGRGEFFGIVGRNGSGKSTLLKCLAGIYDVDQGDVEIHGRLSPFIELGVGFNPDLTARDNVLINGVMLGLTRRQARERFDDVIRFAELEDFLELKLKNYSSGMNVRLAFAVAIQVDAEILLIDEVLAVGDAAFQQKCFDEFGHMKESGRTIILVTHDMSAIERFCDRAMLIEKGQVVEIGDPRRVARRYNELNFGQLVHETADGARIGDHAVAEIVDCWYEDAQGARVTALAQGEQVAVCLEVRFHAPIEDPVFAVSIRNSPRHTVFATSTRAALPQTGSFGLGDHAVARISFENWLAPSRYDATPSVARNGAEHLALDLREDLASLVVHGTSQSGGIVDVPHRIEVRPA